MSDARRCSALLLVTSVLFAGAAAAQTPATEIATGANIPVAAGAMLELRAVNGEATFLKAPGDQVVVEFARAEYEKGKPIADAGTALLERRNFFGKHCPVVSTLEYGTKGAATVELCQ